VPRLFSYLVNLVYLALLAILSPWLLFRAVRHGKYRRGWPEKFLGSVPRRPEGKRRLWFHAVSVGEVNVLRPLLEKIAREHPDWECVISTTTRTGKELAEKRYPHLTVFYCPLDFSWAVRRAMRRLRPEMLLLTELELWPNLIAAAGETGAAVALINGRLSHSSFRGYRRLRPVVRPLLRSLDLLSVQSETYAGRFHALGARPETIEVTGSMKFDGARLDRDHPRIRELARLAGFRSDDIVFLAGSTQEPEEAMALETYRLLAPRWPRLRLVLVPRHPERFQAVARLLADSEFPWQRRSELVAGQDPPPSRILLVDTIGELGDWWGTAHLALVGGSFGRRGGQNMIEPAAYGAAVAFGPNTRNFRDVVTLLLRAEGAQVVHHQQELTDFVRQCLRSPEKAESLGAAAQSLVRQQLGAADRTLESLEKILQNRRLRHNARKKEAA
jgi:3-deoxy-D-manno-octulosonic-acid transferase